MESRTRPSVNPTRSRSACGTDAWVMMAGLHASDSTAPRETARANSCEIQLFGVTKCMLCVMYAIHQVAHLESGEESAGQREAALDVYGDHRSRAIRLSLSELVLLVALQSRIHHLHNTPIIGYAADHRKMNWGGHLLNCRVSLQERSHCDRILLRCLHAKVQGLQPPQGEVAFKRGWNSSYTHRTSESRNS